MEVRLHANATTTPKIRAYIQASSASVGELAEELGVNPKTIRRWRGRTTVEDRSHRPKNLQVSLTEIEERLVCELRKSLALSLDDIVEVIHRCVNPKLSRSAIHRTLQRHALSKKEAAPKPKAGTFETSQPLGFIHLDAKYLSALDGKRSYAFVAIDRATRYVYVEIFDDRTAATAHGFLERFLADFPAKVHTILTDNGSEWTDRFSDSKKGKPAGQPSFKHPIDLLCAQRGIKHKLTRPYRPQTNGMVERFNRRLGEHLAARPKKERGQDRRFQNHQERNRYILDRIAAFKITKSATATSSTSSPTTITLDCDVSATKPRLSSSPISRDTTPRERSKNLERSGGFFG
ncbi:MAG: transposase [Proteobacteria bacterium]|nr:transposase [Pseudomonadota bacterium]